MQNPSADKIVFQTPWFEVLERPATSEARPYYAIRAPDFVSIVGLNAQGELLLVRQFRPAVGELTLELPAGHVDAGETPEESARKELCEEAGCEVGKLELLARFSPSTARFTNRLWIYFGADVRAAERPAHAREAGVEAVWHRGPVRELLRDPQFIAAGAAAALFAAAAAGKIKI